MTNGLQQPVMVKPAYPLQRGQFDGFSGLPRSTAVNQFGFVQTVDGLSQGVVVTVAFAGNYASYCRCVSSTHISNGKKKGEGNTKNGNRYLAWAYVEAANFAIRYCEPARKFHQRKKAKRNNVVAIKAVAHKLARACFHMLKTGERFSVERCFT